MTPAELFAANDDALARGSLPGGCTHAGYLRLCQDLGGAAWRRAVYQLAQLAEEAGDALASPDWARRAHYAACRLDGTPAKLAEMFALGRPPMSNTDREFLHGHANGNQFERTPHLGDYYASVARGMGQDPKGKVYLSGLARFAGDPEAWIESRDEAKRLIESRPGWTCHGAFEVSREPTGGPGKYRVADGIVDARAGELLAGGEAKSAGEAREMARDQLSPSSSWGT